MKKTIWIVNQYASHLEERHLNLASYFAREGHTVVVITASFHHGKHEYLYEEDVKTVERGPGVWYVYLRSSPAYQSNGGKRMVNMADFCRRYLQNHARIAAELGKPDVVIGSSAPPFMWEIAWRTARRFGAKFIAEFRDIWPLSLVEVQGVSPNHPLVKVFAAMERRAYRRSDAIVGTMPYAWRHVCDEMGFPREKFHWMSNGLNVEKADAALESRSPALPAELDEFLTDCRCCVYIGSIVKSESVDYIIECWERVRDKDICLAIIGDGNVVPRIEEQIRSLDTDRVRRFPSIAKEQIPLALEKAFCCLAAVPDYPIYRFGLSMNKLYDYLYAGKPVVFVCGAENIVSRVGGFVVPFGDRQAMADAIEGIRGLDQAALESIAREGKKLIREEYDYRIIARRYLELMESL